MRVVVGISGATGVILGLKCIKKLLELGHFVHFVMTSDAHTTAEEEMGKEALQKYMQLFKNSYEKECIYHSIRDFTASIASGSFIVDAMIVVPCSMATLAAVSMGLGDNLLRRAADVTIKE